jgi:putative DNA primase/helicase
MYYGEATRFTGRSSGRREDCRELVSLWTDTDCAKLSLDKNQVCGALKTGVHLPPSLIIDSGYGIHARWLFTEKLDISVERPGWQALEAELVAALRGLAGLVAGDLAVCDLARVMRLPATHNTKQGELVPCRILEASWARYEWRDLQEMLDWHRPVVATPELAHRVPAENPFSEFARRFATKAPLDVRQRLEAMDYRGQGDTAIHQTQLQVSASLARAGVDDEAICALILDATHRSAGLAGERWNWQREEANLRRMITDWRKKHGSESPPPRQPAPVIQLRPQQQDPAPEPAPPPSEAPSLAGFPLNDLGNAMRLIVQHGTALRYISGIGWHAWDGTRYAVDLETIAARRLAHETARTMLGQAFDMPQMSPDQAKTRGMIIKFAINSGNSNRITAMLAQAEPHLAVAVDNLDRDPMLLNCRNGTLDLRSGQLRPHDPADLITKLVPIDFDPAALCPIWERFLLEIFDGDTEMVLFVQRSIGYSLTGLTSEQVVFILWGAGSNGKSVLIETVCAVLADYVRRSPTETWVSKATNGPSNDIAALAGARFVSVIETEHDKQLAEALVKQATGGDAMTARFHYKEFFSFVPQFKLWFATNHRPRIRGSDFAIWRRILLLAFVVTFVDEGKEGSGQKTKDPELKNKLEAEFPGILAWMVRGCKAWQEVGLKPPVAVIAATESYQDSQDNVSGFLRDCCHQSRGLSCGVGLLYAGYQVWCEENDEEALDKRKFGKNLDERGYPPGARSKKIKLRNGIDLKQEYRDAAATRMNEPGAG